MDLGMPKRLYPRPMYMSPLWSPSGSSGRSARLGGVSSPESFPAWMSWGSRFPLAGLQVRVQSCALCFPLHADPFANRLQQRWRRLQSPVQPLEL